MTLLSIIGDDVSRIVPLLYAYKGQIKHHVLLCDDAPVNYRRAKALQRGMQRFSAKYHLGWYIKIVSTNEDSATDIEQSVRKQFSNVSELWLNATDGYPAITILLANLIRKKGGRILSYDHFDNDLHIIEPDGSMRTEKLEMRIDIESYVMLLNYTIVSKVERAEIAKRKEAVLSLFSKESLFVRVRKALVAKALGQQVEFDLSMSKDILHTLKELGIVDRNLELIPSRQKALQGDLYEEYVFWLCESLNPDDILMAVKIDFDDEKYEPFPQNRVMNEFDILMMHNNRMFTIECKFSKELEGLEFIYKYDAIIDYFGNASKAIIANISSKPKEPYLNSKTSSNFRPSALRRGYMAGIAVYHESQMNAVKFQNLVRNFFSL